MDVAGKSVVLTGTFHGVTRAVAEAGLAARGANLVSAVSKKTDVVFAGDDAGSNLEKARALGVRVLGQDALLAVLTGCAPSATLASHPFHAAFDRLAQEVQAHPRVHIAALFRGAPRDPSTIAPRFVERFGIAPGDDVRSFYATRDGCALVWMDRDDPALDAHAHRFEASMPRARVFDDLMTDTTHAVVMPPLDDVLGPRGMDYACENVVIGAERTRYDRSFVGFDFPGDYYTPALVVERGRLSVQVGDDHGVFDDGRPTVPFDAYLEGVIATKGSIPWRDDLFGLGLQPQRRLDPRRPLTIDDLLPPTREARAAEDARLAAIAAATPADPRLRALLDAIASATAVSYELQKDGRTLVRLEREDGSRQLAFLNPEQKSALDRALAARA